MNSNFNEAFFPTFEEVKNRKNNRKNVHNPADDNSNDASVKSFDSAKSGNLCKSILSGGVCTYGNRCKNAHYEDEWCIQDCHYGEKCNRVKGKKCKNVDPKNVCFYIHPQEDLDMFYSRLNLDKKKITRPSDEELNKLKHFSKMCNSFFLGVACNKSEGECTYAHSKEELSIKDCIFGENCKHTTCKDGSYHVKDTFICIYKHPSETFDNYKNRVLEPCRKMKKIEKREVEKPKENHQVVVEKQMIEKPKENYQVVEKSWADIMEEEEPKEFDKIIIEVSESMAVEMVKMMIANGKTNFELKIRK